MEKITDKAYNIEQLQKLFNSSSVFFLGEKDFLMRSIEVSINDKMIKFFDKSKLTFFIGKKVYECFDIVYLTSTNSGSLSFTYKLETPILLQPHQYFRAEITEINENELSHDIFTLCEVSLCGGYVSSSLSPYIN